MKTHFKKLTVVSAAIAICFLAACKKDQSLGSAQSPVSPLVNYTVVDRMQVNNEDGKPRAISTLAVLNDETFAVTDAALGSKVFSTKNSSGENLLLSLFDNSDGKLTLMQPYPAANGLASGTIYYAVTKN